MDISIVIVSWNVKKLLYEAIKSVYQFAPQRYSFEVWVVDNDSHDGSADMVEQNFPQVKLIRSGANLGFAAGNNLAMRQANGRVVLCLNPDTQMHEGTLDFIVDSFDRNPQQGAMGVKLLNSDGSLQPSCKGFPGADTILYNALYLDAIFRRSKLFGKYDMTWFDHSVPLQVDQPMGAALAFRKTVLDQVGIYDERYFMYFDEVDLCYRFKKGGWQIWVYPKVVVTHHWASSTSQVSINMNKQWYISFAKYLSKNLKYPKWLAWLILSTMVWLKLVVTLAAVVIIIVLVWLLLKGLVLF